METNYYQKYLKYKNKYLQLKNMIGGEDLSEDDDMGGEEDAKGEESADEKPEVPEATDDVPPAPPTVTVNFPLICILPFSNSIPSGIGIRNLT